MKIITYNDGVSLYTIIRRDIGRKVEDMKTMMINSPELENMDNLSCCCIDHPLFESFKEADAYQTTASIGQAGMDLGKASFVSMINHIIYDHHLFLRTELPVLSECITIINHAHGGKDPELLVLHRL